MAIAQAPLGGKNVQQAVKDVFNHQDPVHQAAILKGVQAGKADPVTVKAIDQAVKAMKGSDKAALAQYLVKSSGEGDVMNSGLGKVLSYINPFKASDFANSGTGGPATGVPSGSAAIGAGAVVGGKTAVALVKNTAKDAVNLPAEMFSSVAVPSEALLAGHPGKAISDVAGPFAQMIEHPKSIPQQILAHPLDSYLMGAGAVHGVTGLAARGIRALPGDALGSQYEVPPSVHLTGNLTHERPALSSYPLIRASQKAGEALKYKKGPTGDLVPRSENLRERLLRHTVSRDLVGVRERIRRAAVDNQKVAHARSVLMSPAERLARSAKKALTYDPGSGLIHGANVLARIADHTVRKPETLIPDLQKHLDSVAATRPDLTGLPKALEHHDKYVAELKAAIDDKALQTPKHVQRLFDASDTYAKDVKPLENEAFTHNHFGAKMSKEGLLRRELQPVVLSHMPGARLDPKLGMVRDVAGKTRKLSTAEMVAFDKAQTGGRPLAYTSHAAPKGDAAFYTSGQKYPVREIHRNTGYAFTHGLSDSTHEALLQHRVALENAINAHRSMDKILTSTVQGHPDGGFWKTFKDAKADAPEGKVPIRVGRLTEKPGAADSVAGLDQEAAIRSLDINERLKPNEEPGKFGLIDKIVVDQLRQHENQISPNTFLRAARATTSQFRRVALGTSLRHLPGIAQEGLIRDIGAGVGVRSLLTGRNVFSELEKMDPRLAAERKVELSGGTLSGMTRMMETRQGSKYFSGSVLKPLMQGVEHLMKSPGPRQMATAWDHWQHFVINGSKNVLEGNQQTAAVGQALLRESGKLMRLQGKAAQDAARGLMDDRVARQLGAQVRRVQGTWTDLTPSGQTALMFSPFGMWWVNSVKWLARLPIDQPVKTGVLASTTVGTEKQRQAEGLDMFSPGRLSDYLQGSIPAGSKLIAQQYYSPAGVAGDPFETAESLVEPTLLPITQALMGDNYLGRQLSSPNNPTGYKTPSAGTDALVVLNSVLSNFLPLYTKAQTVAEGGASAYDTSTLFKPETKGPNPGAAAGLAKIGVGPPRALLGALLRTEKDPQTSAGASNTYSIPKTGASASGGKWSVVQSNPAGTGATGTTWKVVP